MKFGEVLLRLNLVMVSIQSLIRRVPTEVFAEINSIPGTTVRSVQRPQHHQLYCRTGYHLIITPHGAVRGTRDQYNSYSILEFITVAVAVVAIKSVHTGLYLTISPKGDLIGSPVLTQEGLFTERISSSWFNTYTSLRNYNDPYKDDYDERSCKIMTAEYIDVNGTKQLGCDLRHIVQEGFCYPSRDPLGHCFPETIVNETVDFNCGADVEGNMTRTCLENGTWSPLEIDCVIDQPKTCFDRGTWDWDVIDCPELDFDKNIKILQWTSRSISLTFLLTAFLIFFLIRSTRCWRNTIHWNLISALILQMILYHPKSFRLKIKNYKSFFKRLFVEGVYLYVMIGLVFNNDFIKLWMYKVIGWGVPSIPILIWSILMHQSNPIHEELRSDDVISSMCWISDVGNWIVWLRRGPILFILAFNLLILLHIIKILICSQIRNGQDSNQLIKAAKATLILSPLLGITYLLFLYNPAQSADEKENISHSSKAFVIINTILQGFQGTFVSIFYCFANNEIQNILKRKFYGLQRQISNRRAMLADGLSGRFGNEMGSNEVSFVSRRRISGLGMAGDDSSLGRLQSRNRLDSNSNDQYCNSSQPF